MKNIKQHLLMMFVCFLFSCPVFSQTVDTLPSISDSTLITDTSIKKNYFTEINKILEKNIFLNARGESRELKVTERKYRNMELLFYTIFLLLLVFGIMKMLFSRYVNTLLRVFLNTSLRQSQLTDQLLQARLPSLIFNIFFVLIGGYYLYLLLNHLGYVDKYNDVEILLICIFAVISVYTIKYLVLKFTGWISGYQNEADTYIFIVFLINKILALALIPIVIIMAFSGAWLVKIAAFISIIFIGLMLLLRFLRSYSILQNKIHVKRYHFFLYIIGIEILPLLLIYKTAMILLTNNL